ncbi:MAG: acetyltransferase [Magnetococcales bacterium]|nr:acetyltransferase [Magnetococcales bacterium]
MNEPWGLVHLCGSGMDPWQEGFEALFGKIIMVGGGGHARVLWEVLVRTDQTKRVIGLIDPDPQAAAKGFPNLPLLGDDNALDRFDGAEVTLINGLGSVGNSRVRAGLFETRVAQGFQFESLLHPGAILASKIQSGMGFQLMAGAVVQPGCVVGRNVLINTRAVVDHDCHVADHVHVAPGAVLSGSVQVGAGSHIGAGATVLQGVRIGRRVIVGAGAVVIKDIADDITVMGVPARKMKNG